MYDGLVEGEDFVADCEFDEVGDVVSAEFSVDAVAADLDGLGQRVRRSPSSVAARPSMTRWKTALTVAGLGQRGLAVPLDAGWQVAGLGVTTDPKGL